MVLIFIFNYFSFSFDKHLYIFKANTKLLHVLHVRKWGLACTLSSHTVFMI